MRHTAAVDPGRRRPFTGHSGGFGGSDGEFASLMTRITFGQIGPIQSVIALTLKSAIPQKADV
jgi:hypothetical protein